MTAPTPDPMLEAVLNAALAGAKLIEENGQLQAALAAAEQERDEVARNLEGMREDRDGFHQLYIETRVERDRLKSLAVLLAIPYEALRLDGGSRRWIAPDIWEQIVTATDALRAALGEG